MTHDGVSEPEIVFRGPERFVGIHGRFRHALSAKANPQEVIPPLWERFGPRAAEVGGTPPESDESVMEYWISIKASDG